MDSTLLLHIGFHKTGTTWLQSKVFSQESLGYCAPWGRLSTEAIDQFVLVNPHRFDPQRARDAFEEGRRDAAQRKLLPVITHEDLCGYPWQGRYYGKEAVERMHTTFPEAKVLISIREQRSSLVSHYREYVRECGAQRIERFLGPTGAPGFSPIFRLDHLEYDLLVEHYRNLSGPDRVFVLPLELLARDRREYCRRLGEFTGVPIERDIDYQPDNVGWRGVTLALRRRFNRFNLGVPDWRKPRQTLGYHLVDRLCRLVDRLTPARFHAVQDARLRRYVDGVCRGVYAKSNRRLSEMTGLDLVSLGYDTG